jgi:hypothetical protein
MGYHRRKPNPEQTPSPRKQRTIMPSQKIVRAGPMHMNKRKKKHTTGLGGQESFRSF